jgi:nucleotide-binding universal stress UspA family protein
VRNPLRSEAEAFRFLLLAVGYFAVIVAAAAIDTWLGLVVFLVLTGAALLFWLRWNRDEPPLTTRAAAHPEDVRRILVVANETVGGDHLFEVIAERAEGVDEEVLVICPALNSPLRTWVSDEDSAREAAQRRLEVTLARLAAAGIDASGEIGDGDPLQAMDDAVRTFGPDEIVISTHPEGRSNWLERGVVSGARARFEVPIRHVVVDLEVEARKIPAEADSG